MSWHSPLFRHKVVPTLPRSVSHHSNTGMIVTVIPLAKTDHVLLPCCAPMLVEVPIGPTALAMQAALIHGAVQLGVLRVLPPALGCIPQGSTPVDPGVQSSQGGLSPHICPHWHVPLLSPLPPPWVASCRGTLISYAACCHTVSTHCTLVGYTVTSCVPIGGSSSTGILILICLPEDGHSAGPLHHGLSGVGSGNDWEGMPKVWMNWSCSSW